MVIKLITPLILAMFLVGCTLAGGPAKKPQPEQQGKQVQKVVDVDPVLAEKVKAIVLDVRGVDASTAVVVNKDISIAVTVSGFDRLRMKSIREEIHEKVKQLTGEHKIHISTDKKIFKLLKELEQEVLAPQGGQSLQQIKKRLDKINKKMHG